MENENRALSLLEVQTTEKCVYRGIQINYELGYKPVTFSELTDDNEFWIGCKTCKNYDVLTRTKREMCLCTGMLYEPKKQIK